MRNLDRKYQNRSKNLGPHHDTFFSTLITALGSDESEENKNSGENASRPPVVWLHSDWLPHHVSRWRRMTRKFFCFRDVFKTDGQREACQTRAEPQSPLRVQSAASISSDERCKSPTILKFFHQKIRKDRRCNMFFFGASRFR